jgi:hypothetical protein
MRPAPQLGNGLPPVPRIVLELRLLEPADFVADETGNHITLRSFDVSHSTGGIHDEGPGAARRRSAALVSTEGFLDEVDENLQKALA